MRCNISIGFALLAACGVSAVVDVSPKQLHLALAGADGVRVAWRTQDPAPAACTYGLHGGALTMSATGTSKQYLAGYGYHHVVRLGGLSPATKYDYQCGNASATDGLSAVHTFTSTKPPGQTSTSLIFGDMGWESSAERGSPLPVGGLETNWSATLSRELMERLNIQGAYDLVWHVGDIGYADDSFGYLDVLLNFTYEEAYDGYMEWLENVTSTTPYMVAVGNHESECHSPACILDAPALGEKLNNFTAYNIRWAMPANESGGVLNMWYSYDHGSVHYVSIDTSTDFPNAPEGETGDGHFSFLPAGHFAPNGTYMKWLEADLAAAQANPSTRWIVAGGHRPFEDLDNANAQEVAALFKKYGVAFYFAGHGHSYSRYNADAWNSGAIHIMVGGAGCDEMVYPPDQFDDSANRPCEQWCADPAVRAKFAPHNRGSTSGGLSAAVPAASAPRPVGSRAGVDGHSLPRDVDPCRYCGGAPASGATPVYTSAKMAIGLLKASDASLEWSLMRAPDGLVLDSVTVQHSAS